MGYKGAVKKMKITRRVLNPDGKTTHPEEKVLTVDVKKGWKAGTKITFAQEGDQSPQNVPADIVFIIRDKPHSLFTREDEDIRYKAKISLKEALCGTTIQVPTLDPGRKIPLKISDVVKPHSSRRIAGEGLPLAKMNHKRGDLIVEFDVKFPDTLNSNAKQLLSDILP